MYLLLSERDINIRLCLTDDPVGDHLVPDVFSNARRYSIAIVVFCGRLNGVYVGLAVIYDLLNGIIVLLLIELALGGGMRCWLGVYSALLALLYSIRKRVKSEATQLCWCNGRALDGKSVGIGSCPRCSDGPLGRLIQLVYRVSDLSRGYFLKFLLSLLLLLLKGHALVCYLVQISLSFLALFQPSLA